MSGLSRSARSAGPVAFRLGLGGAAVLVLATCGGPPPGELRQNTPLHSSALTTPSFVQVAAAVPQSAQTSVAVKYAQAQTKGNLNVVVVGWNDATAAVSTVTDTAGNTYLLAVGPTAYPGTLSQSIYYAANIAAAAAGANSVTVKFGTAAGNPDIRILEYGGIATSGALDTVAAASGSGATSDSGPLTTSGASELLVAANMVSNTTNGPGAGFTQRILTNPDSDIAEDEVAASAGTYHGTAPVYSSLWVMQMVAFRSTTVAPPTAPGGLTATAASSSQINLAWTASTSTLGIAGYRVERCLGASCSNFAQIATPTATTYSDGSCAPNTAYSYRVRAADTAGTLSTYSNTASATTPPDTQPPSAPSNLAATAPSSTQVSLTWTASTDNVGVTGYLVERCTGAGCSSFAQVGTSTAAAYNDSGLTAGTAYSYRVRATDAASNLSAYSNIASVTTPAPDTQPPTAPSGLSATAASSVQLNLSWTASTDNVGVTGYFIERCQGTGCANFAQVAAPAGTSTSYADNGLLVGTSYSYRVRATDAVGNLSGYSNIASATTLTTVPNPVIPSFTQGNSTSPQGSISTVSVSYTGVQTLGNFNVVVVGWNDTSANVTSVTDSKGNVYARAIGPTSLPGVFSESIYYATNIAGAAAGANAVTITFSPAATAPDVRIFEYRGIAHSNPVDVTTFATGNSATSSTPSITANAGDLLLGANLVTFLTAGPGPGYVQRSLTVPDGDIVEDRVAVSTGSYSATAALQTPCGWLMQLVAFKAAPPDPTPPNVAITSPSGGASLSGTVTVNVTASDSDSGLQSIQLLVDGNAVGTIVSTSPASFSLNTTQFTNGGHSIGASAVNGSGGVGFAAPVAATFTNASPGNPAVSGLWSGLIPLPIIAVHVSQLPNGRLLIGDGQSFGIDTRTWDPATNAINSVPVPSNTFCSGHEQFADGRVFFGGGHNGADHMGLTTGNLFDPVTSTWAVTADMAHPRWYPTATTLPDGRVLMLSGETTCAGCLNSIAEIYSPATNSWTQLNSIPFTFPYYPHVFVLPDGRVLVPSTGQASIVSQILDLTKVTWTSVGGVAVDGGSAAMYRPGKILKAGTSVDPELGGGPSVSTAYVLDMTQTTPTWRKVGSLNHARTYHVLTLLPDGNVLVTGGGSTTAPTDTANAVLSAEVWSAATETWTALASMHAPRLYHSNAILMPDARVLILGGGRLDDAVWPYDQFNAEFFSPPYLFKGPRPVITSAPSTIAHNQVFTVQTPDASRIASVSLMRFTTVTHAINMGQRYVPLAFTAGSGALTVTGPVDANLATPGNYMLFLVDTNGVPSVATTVRL
jgi:chitodextrinase